MKDYGSLVASAAKARESAYAPYSRFPVGAALLATDGTVFLGANVENSAFPLGMCAERNALGAAVTAGRQKFEAIAVVLSPARDGRLGSPCGACRQALAEFGLDLLVILAAPDGSAETVSLRELLPRAFSPENL